MISKIGKETSDAWSHLDGGSSAPWGGVFKVQWISVYSSFVIAIYLPVMTFLSMKLFT